MSVYYSDESVVLHHGDCLDVLRDMADNSVDAVVCDPPYGLANTTPEQVSDTLIRWINGERDYLPEGAGFMGKSWDAFVPPVAVWDDCMRVLKPGGHLLAFAGSRTHDLMALGIRLAGFDIRDSIAWLYGSGFPKSLDVSKAIDKAAGATREVVGSKLGQPGYSLAPGRLSPVTMGTIGQGGDPEREAEITAPATPDAERWQGWGTALKPAFEPIVVARKPLGGTVAANVLEWGTGALNVDGCRVGTGEDKKAPGSYSRFDIGSPVKAPPRVPDGLGRWPTNVVLDGDAASELDAQSGTTSSTPSSLPRGTRPRGMGEVGERLGDPSPNGPTYGDTGGASRFFPTFRYQAKAPTRERIKVGDVAHPTVKPLALMRWLVRLVTPPGGVVLDPFAGSGTTIEAAILEGFRVIGIEREADYLPLIEARIARATPTQEPSTAAAEALALFDLEEPA